MRLISFYSVLTTAIVLMSLMPIAAAETMSICDSIPIKVTDWNSYITLPKFDPEMGLLTGINLRSEINLSESISLENLNNNPANYSIALTGGLEITLPNSSNLSQNINQSSEGYLGGFDGSNDYSGPSGLNIIKDVPVEPVSESYSELADFIASSSGEKAVLPASASFSSLIKSNGSASSISNLMAGAHVCITYTYEPNATK